MSSSSPPSPPPTHVPNLISNTSHHSADEPINYVHMELLIHMLTSNTMYNLSAGPSSEHIPGLLTGLSTSLHYPFLLPALLAFSARHLAHLHPERSTFYLHLSTSLQTQSLSLFNAARCELTPQTSLPLLLFSSVLAQDLLADTLAARSARTLDAWLDSYVQCIETHRGIYTIASTAWLRLLDTEIGPIIAASRAFTSRDPRGTHCERVAELVASSFRLSEGERAACGSAVRYLQVGFDAVFGEEDEGRFHMLFTWTMLAAPDFTGLLARRCPEALVALAYYAWLLHCGRGEWQVGDAGVYIFGLIDGFLGDEWEKWLARLRREILG